MTSVMTRMTKADFPTDKNGIRTKAATLHKYRTDHIFKQRMECNGFSIVGDNIIFPNGLVAGANVK